MALAIALLATVALAGPLEAAPASAATMNEVTPVYRFYKTTDGAHFFTSNETEKNQLRAQMGVYDYEGIAFYAHPAQGAGTAPVYRFYNVRTGVHFYTISESERQALSASVATYRTEGIAYYAFFTASTDIQPVYRFYKFQQGVHFHTDNPDEAGSLRATASATYRDEGVAYFVPSRLTLSGTGNGGTTERVVLPEGLNQFSFSYTGNGNFSAYVSREDGQYTDYLIKKTGPTESSVATGLVEARYAIGVEASGPWSISVEFPKASSASLTDFTGTGTQVTPLFALEQGVKTIFYQSSGEYFRAVLIDANGNEVDYPVFETGPSIAAFYPFTERGLYAFQVHSNGDWKLSIR